MAQKVRLPGRGAGSTQGPTTPQGPVNTASSTISVSQVGEQMCHIQSDIRKLTRQSRDMMDISQKMLEEQQMMRRGIGDLIDLMKDFIVKMEDNTNTFQKNITESTKKFQDGITESTSKFEEKITESVEENDRNVTELLELIYENMDENKINMEIMNNSIEVIAQSALTLAYVTGKDDEEVEAAKNKAIMEIAKNDESNKALRSYHRAIMERQYGEAREKRLKNRKKPKKGS